jgi:hypothetical protein
VTHRFGSAEDYRSGDSPVKSYNSVCLSPLGSRIGLDYIFPIDMPVKPQINDLSRPVHLTVQGHFNLRHRDTADWLRGLDDGTSRVALNFMGGNAWKVSISFKEKHFKFFSDLSESVFYYLMNFKTHFILPLIDGEVKSGTYIKERYSSNFNQAFALEKPVFCHEIFKDIYGVPGIYYNHSNVREASERIFSMTDGEYRDMLGSFRDIKAVHRSHNNAVLAAKVAAVSS